MGHLFSKSVCLDLTEGIYLTVVEQRLTVHRRLTFLAHCLGLCELMVASGQLPGVCLRNASPGFHMLSLLGSEGDFPFLMAFA